MTNLINPQEILDLIYEVGHIIQLCDRSLSPSDLEFGIPDDVTLSKCRRVRGYVIPEQYTQIATSGGQSPTGGFVAYLSAKDLLESEVKAASVMIFDERVYQLDYLESISHRGQVMLHKVKLLSAQAQGKFAQPDKIYEYNPTRFDMPL